MQAGPYKYGNRCLVVRLGVLFPRERVVHSVCIVLQPRLVFSFAACVCAPTVKTGYSSSICHYSATVSVFVWCASARIYARALAHHSPAPGWNWRESGCHTRACLRHALIHKRTLDARGRLATSQHQNSLPGNCSTQMYSGARVHVGESVSRAMK